MQNSDFSQQNSPATDFSQQGTSSEATSSGATKSSGNFGSKESSWQDTSSANTKRDAKTAVREEAESAYHSAVQTGKRLGETVADEAKHMVGETVEEAKGQVKSTLNDQKGKAAENLDQMAGVLRRTSEELAGENQAIAQYAEAAASQVERFSGYLKNHEVSDLVNDLRNVAHRQPEMFVAGALAAGFLIGRFLKSSGAQATSSSYNQGGAYGQANYGRPYGQTSYGQPSAYGTQYGSTSYESSPYGTTWEQSQPSTSQDIPISTEEERYGR